MYVLESKHKGEGFVKNTYIILFYVMYKQTLHTSEQVMRIDGAPRYHISTVLQTPPAFLVLSSHAYSALRRFLICFQGNHLYLWFFFFALVYCSLYTCHLRFAWTLPKSSPIFGRKWTTFSSLCHHVALSWRSCYNWVLFGLKSVRCIFTLQSGHPFVYFPMAKYAGRTMCWCQNLNHSTIH